MTTDEQNALIRKMYIRGDPIVDIAAAVGLSPKSVNTRRRKMDLPSRLTMAERHDRWSERWTPEEDERLRTHIAAGLFVSEIAPHMGRTMTSIRARIALLKLSTKRAQFTAPPHLPPRLCWDCRLATRPNDCAWAKDGTPIPGWDAVENKLGWRILKCPKFKSD